jgi:hypothetical protein
VDRAALDFAISHGIDHGGFVPRGRKAEDGTLPPAYNVTETETSAYAERTRGNVLESDGTLVICEGKVSGGTALTIAFARRTGRPVLIADVAEAATGDAAKAICVWIGRNRISVLNVAGPRELQRPGIYGKSLHLLEAVFGHH